MRTLLRNARIWDGVADGLAPGREVMVENGRVLEIGGRISASADETIDLRDRFLMPGLIDAHFHSYWGPPSVQHVETLPLSYLAHWARRLLEDALRRGFTTVRDAGGADWGLWRATEDGLVDGPRLFYSGRALSQTGGHGDSRTQHVEPCSCRFIANLSEVADGVDEVRRVARETLRRGAHQLKIFLSGGVVSPSDPISMAQYSDSEVRAVVEEAASRKTYVMAHAYTAEAVRRAAEAGVRSVEHGNLLDAGAASAMAAHGAFLTPTLVTYSVMQHDEEIARSLSKEAREKLEYVAASGVEAVRIAAAAGVRIGFGTDLAGPVHRYQRDEFRLRAVVDRPIDVLRSATSINAEIMGQSGRLGCVREGAAADLIAVHGDPREDLSCFAYDAPDPPFIMRAGRIVRCV